MRHAVFKGLLNNQQYRELQYKRPMHMHVVMSECCIDRSSVTNLNYFSTGKQLSCSRFVWEFVSTIRPSALHSWNKMYHYQGCSQKFLIGKAELLLYDGPWNDAFILHLIRFQAWAKCIIVMILLKIWILWTEYYINCYKFDFKLSNFNFTI